MKASEVKPERLTSRHLRRRGGQPIGQHVRPMVEKTDRNGNVHLSVKREEVAIPGAGGKRTVKDGNVVYISKMGAPGTMKQTIRNSSSSKMRNGRKRKSAHDRLARRCDRQASRAIANEVGCTPNEAWRFLL